MPRSSSTRPRSGRAPATPRPCLPSPPPSCRRSPTPSRTCWSVRWPPTTWCRGPPRRSSRTPSAPSRPSPASPSPRRSLTFRGSISPSPTTPSPPRSPPPPPTAAPASRGGAGPAGGGREAALRPRGVGEVVTTASALYRRTWRLLVATAAVVVVPVQLVSSFANRNLLSQIGDTFRSMQKGLTPVTTGGTSVGSPGALLALLALPFLTAALATAAPSCYMGRPITPCLAPLATIRRFWAILRLGLLP